MALQIGQRLGSFEVTGALGAGGMGEVYQARDTRLGRDVAIKVLPEGLAKDHDRLRRFEREARLLAALAHPAIAGIHGIEDLDGVPVLVLELVDGPTLDARLAKGPLPLRDAIEIAGQIAAALEAAHDKDIVHRDLKPSNIKLTRKGRVKLLDFGIAKAIDEGSDSNSRAPTMTATERGVVLGTPAYMSPEQARGEPVDKRTDVWSLGCVLFEMLAGRRAFGGPTASDSMAAVLEREPDWKALPAGTPDGVLTLLRRCLQKDRQSRLRDVGDARIEIEELARRTAPQARPRVTRGRVLAAGLGIPLVAVAWLGTLALRARWSRPPAAVIRSIAVLPLENLSRDPEQEYFADGMTEALITDLAKVGSLSVISRTSAMQYKRTDKPLQQIGKELKADAIVEGSVQRVGDQVKVTAQLIQAATDHHLWAESYVRDLRDVLALQAELARAITREVAANLTPDEQSRLVRSRPVEPEAYETYLRGIHLYNRRIEADMRRGLGLFEKVIALDPGYAPAYLGVCQTLYTLGYTGWGAIAPREAMPKARAACAEALRLDDSLAPAHATIGAILANYDWDGPGAQASFLRAIRLSPSDQTTLNSYAWFLSNAGRHDEALVQVQRAQQLDPVSLSALGNHGWLLFWARQYDGAIAQFEKALDLSPDRAVIVGMLGTVYLQKRMYAEAIELWERSAGLAGRTTSVLAQLGYGYAVAGRKGEARRILDELTERAKREYVASYWIAMVHHGLGQDDAGLASLERAFQDREALPLLEVEPRWDRLRSDPRFQALQRRVGLAAPKAH